MTNSGSNQPPGGFEYPSLEHSPPHHDPNRAADYPADAGLPPPVSPPPYPGPSGYPATPGYPGTGYDPYRPTKPPGTNGMAIASLVVSVTSIMFFCGLPAFIGLILGVMAMRETRRTGQDGHGLALAGTVIGGLATAAGLIVMLAYVALIASGWQWI